MTANIKDGPQRTLTHVIGHDAAGKGGRSALADLGASLGVLGVDTSTQPAVIDGPQLVVLPEKTAQALTIGDGLDDYLSFDTSGRALLMRAPNADLSLPAEAIVNRGGRLEVQRWNPPVSKAANVQTPATVVQDTTLSAYNARNWQMIPAACKVGGRLWCFWYGPNDGIMTGNGEVKGSFGIAAFSDDNGATWTEAFYVVPPSIATDRVWDFSLVEVNGRLLVLYTLSGGSVQSDGYYAVWMFWLNNPLAQKERFAFSGHRFVDYGIPYNFFEIDGKLHIPISYWPNVGNPQLPERTGRFVYRLDRNAEFLEKVFLSPFETEAYNTYDERQIVQTRDGLGLYSVWRTTDGIYESRSTDLGETWSDPTLFTAISDVGVASKVWMGRTPSGRLALILNKHPTQRINMTVFFSEDEGVTWPFEHTFFSGTSSYPVAVCDGDSIYAFFDARRGPTSTGVARIAMTKISEASVIAASPTATTYTVSQMGS